MYSIRHSLQLITFVLVLVAGSARAATTPVSAFGFALGEHSAQEALKRGGVQLGTNRYSGGKMFQLPADSLGVEGVQAATLIYNVDGSLAAIIVTMQKSRFGGVYEYLAEKYALREQRRPFVGNQYARFGAPGATIELNAPHMSFSMSLMYQQDSFVAAYKRISASEAAQKRANEASRF